MPTIYVDTDNSNPDPKKKLYRGELAGAAQFKAEEKIQLAVKKVIDNAPDFTTTKFPKAKGYSIRIKVSKVAYEAPDTKCSISGELLRWPPEASMNKGNGEHMVGLLMTSSAKASGKSERAILDCVEATTEDLVTKSLKGMQIDFARR